MHREGLRYVAPLSVACWRVTLLLTGSFSVLEPLIPNRLDPVSHIFAISPARPSTHCPRKRLKDPDPAALDSSDIVFHMFDARDPSGTLCERALDSAPFFSPPLVWHRSPRTTRGRTRRISKMPESDLVPTWVTPRYISHLAKAYATLSLRITFTRLFTQDVSYGSLSTPPHARDKRQILFGLLVQSNVGKSPVINHMERKGRRVAPVPSDRGITIYHTPASNQPSRLPWHRPEPVKDNRADRPRGRCAIREHAYTLSVHPTPPKRLGTVYLIENP
ncbi:GTPase required for pre-60S ribosomal subunit nuclear export and maturation [Ceratobasidium sp. 428]|nr:GTPase required for pre-60S ribosomal subunit nuclear export and maturation [Ceratobasidium sp. 428]